jgi:transketolase
MSNPNFDALDLLSINTIRTLSIDAIQKANSGHPGLPLGAAPMAYVLWQYHLKHDPKNPLWPDRDRFVLSPGHGSMLLYSLLHLSGYDLPMSELQRFRQLGSKTPGHPEAFLTPGVECTTGPLGQGSVNAVGMAMAERKLAHLFNREGHTIVDHFTYALVSDGDLMEGVSAEAASLAGHLKLGKLIYLYDANDITLDGPTSLTFSSEDVAKRYESYGWQVLYVRDGNTDLSSLDHAIRAARSETKKPSLIVVKTTIGYGSPNKQGTSGVHGSPLGPDELALTKKALGWTHTEPFSVPPEVRTHMTRSRASQEWDTRFEAYSKAFPELAALWKQAHRSELPTGWDQDLASWKPGDSLATREASGKALNSIAKKLSWLIGGDADLGGSTNTVLKDGGSFEGQSGSGRNIHYGVREHAMASIANGIAYHGGLKNFTATFFCFADYMRPAVRLAAMNHLPVVHVWTHDSIGLGEDGPTHQPVEHLMSLRCMPNLLILRPADAYETAEAWRIALSQNSRPSGLVLTRQKLPALESTQKLAPSGVACGAYILSESAQGAPEGVLLASGSEVHIALEAQKLLAESGRHVRVVSVPSFELFFEQPKSYRDQVLPPSLTARVSIEAGSTLGWERLIGTQGKAIGLDRFGGSAPATELYCAFGITAKAAESAMLKLLRSHGLRT